MSAGTIREFLVLLGYKVDPGSEARFTRSIGAATLQAKLLGDAIESAAKAVHDAVAGIARDLEQLYFASKRTGAAVENIKAMQLALTQMGGSADGALGTLESIARFMRNNPAGEGFIRGLGVQTRGTNGALRDTSEIVTDLGKRLAAMPSYMANAYAGVLGIDERTLLALREGLGDYAETYHRFVAAAHIDQQKAASDSLHGGATQRRCRDEYPVRQGRGAAFGSFSGAIRPLHHVSRGPLRQDQPRTRGRR
jgi:hypothetical protein